MQSDIFSFGVVLWEIVTGGFATRGRLHPAVVPEQCPQTIADLISACMRVRPPPLVPYTGCKTVCSAILS